MKKLTDEEYDSLPLVFHGRASKFYREIISLKKGEKLFIGTKEWNMNKNPGRICRYIERKIPGIKYLCGKVADGSGWAIKRLE